MADKCLISTADSATLKLDNQKNEYKGVFINQEANSDPLHCPVCTLRRHFLHPHKHNALAKQPSLPILVKIKTHGPCQTHLTHPQTSRCCPAIPITKGYPSQPYRHTLTLIQRCKCPCPKKLSKNTSTKTSVSLLHECQKTWRESSNMSTLRCPSSTSTINLHFHYHIQNDHPTQPTWLCYGTLLYWKKSLSLWLTACELCERMSSSQKPKMDL